MDSRRFCLALFHSGGSSGLGHAGVRLRHAQQPKKSWSDIWIGLSWPAGTSLQVRKREPRCSGIANTSSRCVSRFAQAVAERAWPPSSMAPVQPCLVREQRRGGRAPRLVNKVDKRSRDQETVQTAQAAAATNSRLQNCTRLVPIWSDVALPTSRGTTGSAASAIDSDILAALSFFFFCLFKRDRGGNAVYHRPPRT